MLNDVHNAQAIRCLLENIDLKIVLDSPNNDYRVEYSTTSIKDRLTGQSRQIRTYRLLDLLRGGVTLEPWDAYDLDKQAALIAGLIGFSQYRMTNVSCGWEVTCTACGHIMRGKIWKSGPRTCRAKIPRKCLAPIDASSVAEVPFRADAP
ncbi:hypothetical protein [Paraburkholderia sediminicola]|uniref:hypothetical protein n=1 Tax=Paraburkholderia sediminicola TaxID=458836 RepID=UPI0038BD92D8